jgi:hypothetical protein
MLASCKISGLTWVITLHYTVVESIKFFPLIDFLRLGGASASDLASASVIELLSWRLGFISKATCFLMSCDFSLSAYFSSELVREIES